MAKIKRVRSLKIKTYNKGNDPNGDNNNYKVIPRMDKKHSQNCL